MSEILLNFVLAIVIVAGISFLVVMPIAAVALIGEWLWGIFKRRK